MSQQPPALNHENVSTSALEAPPFWLLYVFIIFGARYVLNIISFGTISEGWAWNIVHLSHCVVTYIFFHMWKGSAFPTDRQDLSKLTLWEQMSNGHAFTPTKKFLTIVPVALFIMTWYVNDLKLDLVNIFNLVTATVMVIAKLPMAHGMRLFGINSE